MSVQLLKGEFKDPCRAFDFSNLGDAPCLQTDACSCSVTPDMGCSDTSGWIE